jgi:ribosomal protein S18 acetylase RimI-like enzyme
MSEGTADQPVSITGAANLTPAELAEAQELKRVCDAADGLDLKLAWGGDPDGAATLFLARAEGHLVGYCSLDGDGSVAELCGMVAPDWRRRGLGLRLFETARAAFRNGGGEQLIAICEDASTAGRAFIGALAGQRAFTEHRMELATPAPAQAVDDGLVIQQLASDGEKSLVEAARITGAAFGRPLEQTLRQMRADADQQPAQRLYLALVGDEPVGAFKLYADEATVGIYGLAVDTARQRQGWGRRMLARACAMAREQGAARVTLEVDTTNYRAIALYTSSGFEKTTTYGYYIFSRTLLTAGPGFTLDEVEPGAE